MCSTGQLTGPGLAWPPLRMMCILMEERGVSTVRTLGLAHKDCSAEKQKMMRGMATTNKNERK